uniref:Uncharacterized protein n=1 Tax=Romanomermis culicivorax TaxID=13658 RepID=A0A915KRS6_ROMCU
MARTTPVLVNFVPNVAATRVNKNPPDLIQKCQITKTMVARAMLSHCPPLHLSITSGFSASAGHFACLTTSAAKIFDAGRLRPVSTNSCWQCQHFGIVSNPDEYGYSRATSSCNCDVTGYPSPFCCAGTTTGLSY